MNVLVLEDDISAALDIELILNDIGGFDIFRATSTDGAQSLVQASKPDLIIADILLDANANSLSWLKENAFDIPLIILTNNFSNEYYEDSLRLNAQAYLMKPINAVSLKFEIERIFQNIQLSDAPNEKIMIKEGKKFHFLNPKDVIWIQTEGNYSTIKTATKKIVIKTSLSKIIDQVKDINLIRTHRSALIGIKKIDGVDLKSNAITMIDGTMISIGKAYRDAFTKALTAQYDKLT